jgi:hypothetical protein
MQARYVILRHAPGPASSRPLHWDLMLEQTDGLRTWALDREPCLVTRLEAEELPLHRAVYLDYEGPVSGGRGEVSQWDAGTYAPLDVPTSDTPIVDVPNVDVPTGEVLVRLNGRRLQTTVRITRDDSAPASTASGGIQRWIVRFGS